MKTYFFIFLLLLCACSPKVTQDGLCHNPINPSQREVKFDAQSNAETITIEQNWWWVNFISLNDDDYSSDGIYRNDNFLLKESEFTIERRNSNEVHISMTENQSGSERILKLGLQAGNCFDYIKILQSED